MDIWNMSFRESVYIFYWIYRICICSALVDTDILPKWLYHVSTAGCQFSCSVYSVILEIFHSSILAHLMCIEGFFLNLNILKALKIYNYLSYNISIYNYNIYPFLLYTYEN